MAEAKSTQPQLPPPKPVEIVWNHWIHRTPEDKDAAFYRRDEVDVYFASLLAENESLKAQHATDAQVIDRYAKEHLEVIGERDKAAREASQLRLAFVLSDTVLPAEFELELPPTKRLHAYIDRLLEVVREYRSDHDACFTNELGLHKDYRCPTCIKADALLPKEGK